jgi:EpsI family protein
LARLPAQIASWRGEDVPLDPSVVEQTDADQVLNRRYIRQGGESVMLYISNGVRARDLVPHRPEVCYPGSGWTLIESTPYEPDGPELSRLRYRILRFERTGLSSRRLTVLSYYIIDGRYAADVSLLRSRIWRRSGGAEYVTQVQILCTESSARDPRDLVRNFAIVSAPAIQSLLPPETSSAS